MLSMLSCGGPLRPRGINVLLTYFRSMEVQSFIMPNCKALYDEDTYKSMEKAGFQMIFVGSTYYPSSGLKNSSSTTLTLWGIYKASALAAFRRFLWIKHVDKEI